jgi:hypothetical protein
MAAAGSSSVVHISNISVASLFQQLQSLANGAPASVSFGTQLTGQNLPTMGANVASGSSLGAAPLSATPSSQFASNVLSELLSAQESQPSSQNLASQIISAINPNGDGSLSLAQVEQSLTGSSATTSPQQTGIANAFAQLDANGDGALSQSELAQALQSLQQNDPFQGVGGHHHHHHHHIEDQASSTANTATTSTSATAAEVDEPAAGASIVASTPAAVSGGA